MRLLPPQGISIGVFQVDYRGNVYVPSDNSSSRADFQASYFFAGRTGPTYQKSFSAGFNDNVLLTNQLGVGAVVWSPCGATTNFRVNTAIVAYKPNPENQDTQIEIDTTDVTVQRGFRFYVTYKTCR